MTSFWDSSCHFITFKVTWTKRWSDTYAIDLFQLIKVWIIFSIRCIIILLNHGKVLTLKVIIAGAGDMGTELAKRLSMDDHDVVVLEKDSQKISSLSNKLDAMVLHETGQRISALVDAGVKEADVFIAVTDSDELNIMFCMIAKRLGNIKTVARVRNPEYKSSSNMLTSEQLGIDIMIDPEKLAALEIASLIENPDVSDIEDFAEGKIELIALKADKDSELINQPLTVLPLSPNYVVVGIFRKMVRLLFLMVKINSCQMTWYMS